MKKLFLALGLMMTSSLLQANMRIDQIKAAVALERAKQGTPEQKGAFVANAVTSRLKGLPSRVTPEKLELLEVLFTARDMKFSSNDQRGLFGAVNTNINLLLHDAVKGGHLNVIRNLIANGADVNGLDVNLYVKRTPLHYAIQYKQPEAYDLLLRRSADKNVRDSSGKSLLHLAVMYDQPDRVTALLKEGFNVNDSDASKKTPLHYAAMNNLSTIASNLVAAGANIDARDSGNSTPYDLAIAHLADKTAHFLFNNGADSTGTQQNVMRAAGFLYGMRRKVFGW